MLTFLLSNQIKILIRNYRGRGYSFKKNSFQLSTSHFRFFELLQYAPRILVFGEPNRRKNLDLSKDKMILTM